jgi:two-component system chemotaxis sensor kinase CheA
MTIDMTQFYQVFFDEASEHLASMEGLLLALDLERPGKEELNAIFRAAHSIKGGAGTFGFTDMTEVTHVAETLLDRVRKGELAPSAEMVDALLKAGDVIKAQLAAHRSGGESDPMAATEVCARLGALAAGQEAVRPSAAPSNRPPGTGRFRITFISADPIASVDNQLVDVRNLGELTKFSRCAATERGGQAARYEFELATTAAPSEIRDFIEFVLQPEELAIEALPCDSPGSSAEPGSSAAVPAQTAQHEAFGLFDEASAGETEPKAAPSTSTGQAGADSGSARPSTPSGRGRGGDQASTAAQGESSSIRVGVEKVDQLINLVGELVITQAMLAQMSSKLDPVLFEPMAQGLAQLERNTRDLQEAVMGIRMMPIAFVFSRFPRVVRDLAAKLKKQAELKTVGEGTELDRGVIERVADPLTHLVRNSLDHGIERPDARAAAGKPPTGTVTLRAFHQGGNIVIEVADDGAGLSRERILAKARERGLTVSDAMSDQEVWQLIFEPGFSTAELVTDVSGRGVGMDVVKRNIHAMGGRIEIDSQLGQGTRIAVRLPLTLAILDGMSVRVREEVYILPLSFIVESLQPQDAELRTVGGRAQVIQVRGEYLPLVSLQHRLAGEIRAADPRQGIVVIVEAEGAKVALLVDELLGQHQVVIKSLESNYRKVRGISGATIMGDGRVALILDVGALVREAGGYLSVAA